MHFELDRRLSDSELADIERTLHEVLADVRRVVADFPAMTQQIGRMIELARAAAGPHGFDEVNETIAFLRWLLDGTFTFLGYREYVVRDDVLSVVPGSGLGLLGDCDASSVSAGKPVSELKPSTQRYIEQGDLLTVAKTNRISPVRRHARMDYVAVRWERGDEMGECRLIGLFTRKAYTSPAADTPLLGHKLRRILEAEALIDGSHDHRAAIAIFGSFYKDELFAAPWEDLRAMIVVLLAMQADEVRVLGRRTADGRTASLVVALPRRRYSAQLGERIRKLLVKPLRRARRRSSPTSSSTTSSRTRGCTSRCTRRGASCPTRSLERARGRRRAAEPLVGGRGRGGPARAPRRDARARARGDVVRPLPRLLQGRHGARRSPRATSSASTSSSAPTRTWSSASSTPRAGRGRARG